MKSCVRDVMTTPVVAVRKTASFKEMITRMRESGISAFPVVDDGGRVIGVVSQADMLNKEADLATGPGLLANVSGTPASTVAPAVGLSWPDHR